jgi:hypothetical protein
MSQLSKRMAVVWIASTLIYFTWEASRTVRAACYQGCYATYAACVSSDTYREYSGSVASNIFWDPGANSSMYADYNQTRTKYEYQECDYCVCTWIECNYPCKGSYHNGSYVNLGDVIVPIFCKYPT